MSDMTVVCREDRSVLAAAIADRLDSVRDARASASDGVSAYGSREVRIGTSHTAATAAKTSRDAEISYLHMAGDAMMNVWMRRWFLTRGLSIRRSL